MYCTHMYLCHVLNVLVLVVSECVANYINLTHTVPPNLSRERVVGETEREGGGRGHREGKREKHREKAGEREKIETEAWTKSM